MKIWPATPKDRIAVVHLACLEKHNAEHSLYVECGPRARAQAALAFGSPALSRAACTQDSVAVQRLDAMHTLDNLRQFAPGSGITLIAEPRLKNLAERHGIRMARLAADMLVVMQDSCFDLRKGALAATLVRRTAAHHPNRIGIAATIDDPVLHFGSLAKNVAVSRKESLSFLSRFTSRLRLAISSSRAIP